MVVFSKTTTVLLGLATIVSAAPMDQPRKSFTVKQVIRPIAQKKTINIAAMYAYSLSKFGADVPQSVKHAASSGSAVTTPEQDDSEYLTPVNVGGTTLNLDFDTGSADLWVFSNELSSSQQGGHSIYKPASNATKLSGFHWQIYYGDGSSASGDVYKDTVSVGGLTVYNQAVEAANRISSQFVQDKNNDGLLGLAFSSLNTVKPQAQKTFFDTVISELDAPIFAVSLKYHAPGSYDFGFIDKSKHNGSLSYANVDKSQGWWQFTADGYGVGDSVPRPSPIKGIVDTGTTLLLLADDIVDDYYRQVPQANNDYQYGGYVFPCNSSVPTFSIVIGSYKAVIPGEYINYAPVSEGSTTCFGGLQSNQALGVSIFGDIFLKSQYVVFDSRGPKLGFAAQA